VLAILFDRPIAIGNRPVLNEEVIVLKSKLLASVAGAAGLATATTFALGLMAATPTPAQAGVCPAFTGSPGPGATDCNVLLTINAGGTVTSSNPSGTPNYDGSDDVYVGILNNTSKTLNHFLLHGSTSFGGSFGGQDGDGMCQTSRFGTASLCSSAPQNGSHDYAPNGVTFTPISASDGYVDFAGGLAPGGSGFFSLEAPATAGNITISTPEPATLAILGLGLAGLGLVRRRKAQ
jgi:hypothetical protein